MDDILTWASAIGLLTHPSIRLAYSLTKDGYFYRQLVGKQALAGFDQGTENPFLLPTIERRFLFLQEISRDPVLIPLLLRIVESFPPPESFARSGETGRHLVCLLVESFEDIHAHLRSQGFSREAQDLKEHIGYLLVSIGEQQPSVRQRSAKGLARAESKPSEAFKMAKHRLTPRLEHLTDYGLLTPCPTVESTADKPKEFCWRVSEMGKRAAGFLAGLPRTPTPEINRTSAKPTYLPVLKTFFFERAMEYFSNTEAVLVAPYLQPSYADLTQHLFWAYDRCGVKYGYTEFRGTRDRRRLACFRIRKAY